MSCSSGPNTNKKLGPVMVSFSKIGQNNNFIQLLFSKLYFSTYSDSNKNPLSWFLSGLVSLSWKKFKKNKLPIVPGLRNSQAEVVGNTGSLHNANYYRFFF